MKASATVSSRKNKVERHSHRANSFAKVLDGRKQPMRGLWIRNGCYYARLSVENGSNGLKSVRRVPLVNSEGNAVETRAQAEAELARLRTQRTDDALPVLGLTPVFADCADTFLATVKAGKEKKASTIDKEETIIDLWKKHLGCIRLDKIRPLHVASMMAKRLTAGMSKRTVELDIIILRNVLKQARDLEMRARRDPESQPACSTASSAAEVFSLARGSSGHRSRLQDHHRRPLQAVGHVLGRARRKEHPGPALYPRQPQTRPVLERAAQHPSARNDCLPLTI